MHDYRPPVKRQSSKLADMIDRHPRLGWYVAAWAFLVTSNAAWEWFDRILHALT